MCATSTRFKSSFFSSVPSGRNLPSVSTSDGICSGGATGASERQHGMPAEFERAAAPLPLMHAFFHIRRVHKQNRGRNRAAFGEVEDAAGRLRADAEIVRGDEQSRHLRRPFAAAPLRAAVSEVACGGGGCARDRGASAASWWWPVVLAASSSRTVTGTSVTATSFTRQAVRNSQSKPKPSHCKCGSSHSATVAVIPFNPACVSRWASGRSKRAAVPKTLLCQRRR